MVLKVFSAFAGYGTDNFALKRLGIQHECVGYSEIDKYACQCFDMNHSVYAGPIELGAEYGEQLKISNYGDMTKINPEDLPDFDLFTGGFPCQAFSVAGKGKGELDPRGTLFYDIIRICEVKQPKWIFLENVKGLLSKKHRNTFNKILSELDRIGYNVQWQVLNTKEYGVPQNRERVFFVCLRKDFWHGEFKGFPEREELKIFIKDILEPEPVDPKYYLKPHQVEKLIEALKNKKMNSRRMQGNVSSTLLSRDYKDPKVVQIGTLDGNVANTIRSGGKGSYDIKHSHDVVSVQWDISGKGYKSQQDRAYDADGVMACLPNANPSNKVNIFQLRGQSDEVRIKTDGINPAISTTYGDGGGNVPIVNIFALRGRNPENPSDRTVGAPTEQMPEFKTDGVSNTISTVQKDNLLSIYQVGRGFNEGGLKDGDISPSITKNSWEHNNFLYKDSIFRRLTPKECFRLQGFLNDEINLEGLSDTQKYRLAGNGQSVNVVAKIFERMFK